MFKAEDWAGASEFFEAMLPLATPSMQLRVSLTAAPSAQNIWQYSSEPPSPQSTLDYFLGLIVEIGEILLAHVWFQYFFRREISKTAPKRYFRPQP